MRDTALAMATAAGAVRRLLEDEAIRERIERAWESGGIDAAMREIDDRIQDQQVAYNDMARDASR